ncbi:MAG: radical SAM protein [bacterium]|nr:radical SAM protein [bacterium]
MTLLQARKPRLLLVNPWIYDFAAYDLWSQPLGLLLIASRLREAGAEVSFLDCLDPVHPGLKGFLNQPGRRFEEARRRPFGQGRFFSEIIGNPKAVSGIPRYYRRYGVPPELFREDLAQAGEPDLVLVTSGMTYWYPGVTATIAAVREVYPRVPVILGGIYATLLPEHAREFSGADRVLPGRAEGMLFGILGEIVGGEWERRAGEEEIWWSYPALDLKRKPESIPILTSRGCPLRCSYCASRILFPGHFRRDVSEVIAEIRDVSRRFGVRDVVFFDDALLSGGGDYLAGLLQGVAELNLDLRFHSPNGINIRGINAALARGMKKAGFRTLRLSLESGDRAFQEKTGKKVDNREFEQAVADLRGAGFAPDEIGVYILAGLPRQEAREVLETIRYVQGAGARPVIAEYSPIPGTELWKEAVEVSPFDISREPLFHNNTLLPCRWDGFSYDDLARLKLETKRVEDLDG